MKRSETNTSRVSDRIPFRTAHLLQVVADKSQHVIGSFHGSDTEPFLARRQQQKATIGSVVRLRSATMGTPRPPVEPTDSQKLLRQVLAENIDTLKARFFAAESNRTLADKLGIPNTTLRHIRASHVGTSIDHLQLIAEKCNVQPWQLLVKGLGEEQPPSDAARTPAPARQDKKKRAPALSLPVEEF